jgi:hypothetical protein
MIMKVRSGSSPIKTIGAGYILQGIFETMLRIDSQRTEETMEYLKRHWAYTQGQGEFTSLNDYFNHRVVEVGS